MSAKLGKIPPEKLNELLISHRGKKRSEVTRGPSLGRDCALLDFFSDLIVLTCDPVTGMDERAGSLAVHLTANDVVCAGGEPVGVLITLLVPPHAPERTIRDIMGEADNTCRELGMAILGGHTEVTDAVTRTLVHCTGVGRASRRELPDIERVRPKDAIVMTKGAGLEGTVILAGMMAERLLPVLGEEGLARARGLWHSISVVPEGTLALRYPVHCLHDATEGGVTGAVWEVCSARSLGFEICEEAVKVFPETRTLCEHLDIDPLKLISSGTLLIFTPRAQELCAALERANIPASVIGEVLSERERVLIRSSGKRETLDKSPHDELWRVMSR